MNPRISMITLGVNDLEKSVKFYKDSENEVDKIIENAVTAGATLSKAPQKTSWGGYSGDFKDPDGNLWEVAHNPFFWVGPKDENT